MPRFPTLPHILPTTIFCCLSWNAFCAGNWGLSVAHNNPLYADVGGNLAYFGKNWAFEIGVGQMGASGKTSKEHFTLAGGTNVKILFGQTWRMFLDGGVGFGLGGSGSGASVDFGRSPFGGAGVMYFGSTVFSYAMVRHVFGTSGKLPLGAGVGVRF